MISRKLKYRVLLATATMLISAIVLMGLWRVPQGHRGVVVRFGAIRPEPLRPGLHFVPPAPMSHVVMVPVEQIRQLHLNQSLENGGDLKTSEYLTGDENLLQVSVQIDYRVADPLEIARAGLELTDLKLTRLAEGVLVAILARKPVAEILGPDRETISQAVRQNLQQEADRQALGVETVAVIWSELISPKEVQPDFEAAQIAVNEAARMVADSQTSSDSDRIKTGSEAVQIVAQAEATAEGLKAAAITEATRFKAILQQARRTGFMPTAKQLWLDTVYQLIPDLRGRILISTDQPVDLTIIRPVQIQTKP